MSVLNIHDIMPAHNVPSYIATRKLCVLKVTAQVATQGAESAVYECLVAGVVIFFLISLNTCCFL